MILSKANYSAWWLFSNRINNCSGLNAHVKCELKISPMCAGVKHKKLNRSGSIVSMDSRRMSVVSVVTSDSCTLRMIILNIQVSFQPRSRQEVYRREHYMITFQTLLQQKNWTWYVATFSKSLSPMMDLDGPRFHDRGWLGLFLHHTYRHSLCWTIIKTNLRQQLKMSLVFLLFPQTKPRYIIHANIWFHLLDCLVWLSLW